MPPDRGFSNWVQALRRERMTAKSATEKLARRADDEREYDDGDRIVSEGDLGREMFIIAAGRVRISKAGDNGDVTLGYIERGEFFGEMSLLESLPRFASAYAVGPTRVLIIE